MLVRRRHAYFTTALLLGLSAYAQDEPFDCHITLNDLQYDLTPLKGEHAVRRQRDTPPTAAIDLVTFNLCDDLQRLEEVDARDQCPAGTRACLTKTNQKGDEKDRVVEVIPLATSFRKDIEYSSLSSNQGLSITWRGPSYPNPATGVSSPQSFNIKLICDKQNSELNFSSYDGSEMWVEWRTEYGCASSGSSDTPVDKPADDIENGDGKEKKSVGSGLGYFFLLLFLAFVAYFGLGAYYNYSTYGATGKDLIPHRDFWREVPYMLSDVVSHLCSAIRPRTASRGGYIAV